MPEEIPATPENKEQIADFLGMMSDAVNETQNAPVRKMIIDTDVLIDRRVGALLSLISERSTQVAEKMYAYIIENQDRLGERIRPEIMDCFPVLSWTDEDIDERIHDQKHWMEVVSLSPVTKAFTQLGEIAQETLLRNRMMELAEPPEITLAMDVEIWTPFQMERWGTWCADNFGVIPVKHLTTSVPDTEEGTLTDKELIVSDHLDRLFQREDLTENLKKDKDNENGPSLILACPRLIQEDRLDPEDDDNVLDQKHLLSNTEAFLNSMCREFYFLGRDMEVSDG